MNSSTAFRGLEPAGLWQHFEAITRIPRPSKHEEQILDHILRWAQARNYAVARDRTGNACVSVPATPGREKAPSVVCQSHVDMVCERNADSPYDAEKGKIHVVRDGDWLRAEGTTLGADNGLGVATQMYLGEADIPHGPLELLFTVDEETGLTGAKELDPALVRSRILLNLDSEDDGILFVGCAGGTDTRMLWSAPLQAVPAGWKVLKVAVSGLQGGHSGTEINKGRGNAIHTLARLLQEAGKLVSFGLAELHGGNKRNAIPRECYAQVAFPAGEESAFRQAVQQAQQAVAAQYGKLEAGLKVNLEAGAAAQTFSPPDTARLLNLLRAIPTGVVAMSQDIEGLVETSTNLAVLRTAGDTVEIVCSSRSSVAGAMRDGLDALQALAQLAGARIEEGDGYPGWKPDLSSKALNVTKQVYRRLFGSDAAVTAVHAGLECGLIGERIPGIDMVSFGPQITGPHAPGERVHIPSVTRFWKLLTAVLDELSTGRH